MLLLFVVVVVAVDDRNHHLLLGHVSIRYCHVDRIATVPDVIVVVVVMMMMMMMEESSGSYGIVRFGVRPTTVNALLYYSLSSRE